MRKHKYKEGKTAYYIHWRRSNGYTIGGWIEECPIISRYINTPVEPWYWTEIEGKVITMGENELYETEEKARKEIKTRLERDLNRLETLYSTTKEAITKVLKNIDKD